MTELSETLKIWTDGACDPNPGDGGWGGIGRTGRAMTMACYRRDECEVLRTIAECMRGVALAWREEEAA